MLSPRTTVPQLLKAIGVKTAPFAFIIWEEVLDSDIISDAGRQHENTPTMVNVGVCSWCTNCHRFPPAAASARRASSATTKQHKYLTMFMCKYESAPGTQRQQHEPICMWGMTEKFGHPTPRSHSSVSIPLCIVSNMKFANLNCGYELKFVFCRSSCEHLFL